MEKLCLGGPRLFADLFVYRFPGYSSPCRPPAVTHQLVGCQPLGLLILGFQLSLQGKSQEYFEYTPGVLRAYVKPKHLDALSFTLQPVIEAKRGQNYSKIPTFFWEVLDIFHYLKGRTPI